MQENQQSQPPIERSRWRRLLQSVLAPDWARRYRARLFQAYVFLAIIGFAFLALLADYTEYLPFDLELTRGLQNETPGWFGAVLRWINWPGFTPQNIIIVGLTLVILSMLGLRWEGVAAMLVALSTGTLNYLIKIAIRRPRPPDDLVDVLELLESYSFPSGHVMFYTAFFGFLMFLAFTLLRRPWRRALVMLAPGSLIVFVGLARMYVGDHWATDVIAGYLLGSLMLVVSIMVYRWGKPRFFVNQPSAPPAEKEILN